MFMEGYSVLVSHSTYLLLSNSFARAHHWSGTFAKFPIPVLSSAVSAVPEFRVRSSIVALELGPPHFYASNQPSPFREYSIPRSFEPFLLKSSVSSVPISALLVCITPSALLIPSELLCRLDSSESTLK